MAETFNALTFQSFLKLLTRQHDRKVFLVVDNARYHHAFGLIQIRIDLHFLPPYSPEINPAEHIWEHLREKYFYNRHHETMQQVEDNLTNA